MEFKTSYLTAIKKTNKLIIDTMINFLLIKNNINLSEKTRFLTSLRSRLNSYKNRDYDKSVRYLMLSDFMTNINKYIYYELSDNVCIDNLSNSELQYFFEQINVIGKIKLYNSKRFILMSKKEFVNNFDKYHKYNLLFYIFNKYSSPILYKPQYIKNSELITNLDDYKNVFKNAKIQDIIDSFDNPVLFLQSSIKESYIWLHDVENDNIVVSKNIPSGNTIDIFDLIFKLYYSNLRCFYCDIQLKLICEKGKYRSKNNDNLISIDALNPTLGHTFDNTVISCLKCNVAKGDDMSFIPQ